MQDVAELLGMMVEDHKRIQPNVKTYAYDFLSLLIQAKFLILTYYHGKKIISVLVVENKIELEILLISE